MGEDPNREGLLETPKRVIKAYKEYFSGYKIDPDKILDKTFGDVDGYDDMVIQKNISIQIGCGKFLAKALKIPVVSNFRNADIKKGGQGAPLVPIFHKAIFEKKKISTAVINISGISNITWIGDNNKIYSTDIGPGNVLIDQFCMTYYNIPFDRNGKLAKKGKINKSIVSEWMNLPFVKKKLPKSFDNYTFKIKNYITKAKKVDKNILANLTMYSAKLIADISKYFPQTDRWIICGGGALNKQMMKNAMVMSTADYKTSIPHRTEYKKYTTYIIYVLKIYAKKGVPTLAHR